MKDFKSSGKMGRTTFSRESLLRLENLLSETEETGLTVSDIKLFYEEGTVEINSFRELTDDDTGSFQRDPYHIDIKAYGRRGDSPAQRKIWKYANIEIWKDDTNFRLSSEDRTWVLGKRATLLEFLKTQRTWSFADIAFYVSGLGVNLAVLYFLNIKQVLEDPVTTILVYLGFLVGWSYFVYSYLKRKPSNIRLKEKLTRKFDAHLVVAIGSFVVALIGLALTIFNSIVGAGGST